MQIQSLGGEHPMKEGMATHFSFLAWRIPMDRGAWWVTVHRVAKRWTQLNQLSTHRPIDEDCFLDQSLVRILGALFLPIP